MSKTGQITIFVIVGIVVVSLVVGVFVVKDSVLKSSFERQMEQSLLLPEKAARVNSYILSCIEDLSRTAISLVEAQGGYVEVSKEKIPFSDANVLSNRLVLSKSLEVPYWYYKSANGFDNLQVPTLTDIQEEIENYIDENLESSCNFKELDEYKISAKDVKSEVEILSNKINVIVEYPVNIKIQDFSFDLGEDEHKFYVPVETNLGRLVEIGQVILHSLNDNLELETKTLDMLYLNSEIPVNGESLDCTSPVWFVQKVRENLKRIVFENIISMKFKGTNYISRPEDKYFEIGTGVKATDVDVNFVFSTIWPFEMDVEPDDNGILKGQSVSEPFGKLRGIVESFVCLSSWNFVYDLKYPVLIRLSKGDDTFQFSYMVVIARNEPRENVVSFVSPEEFNDFTCKNLQNEASVYTFDSSDKPLDGVSTSYKCINVDCELGSSEFVGDQAVFTSRFPLCINGYVIGSKSGYHFGKALFSSNAPGSVSLYLEPLTKLKLDVGIMRAGSGTLRDGEKVFISMIENEREYGVSAVYPEQNEIELIPGTYNVDLYLMSEFDDPITIPKRDVRRCIKIRKGGISGVLGGTKEECFDLEVPGTSFTQAVTGRSKYLLNVESSDLEKGTVKFFVVYKGKPKKIEDLNVEAKDAKYPVFGE